MYSYGCAIKFMHVILDFKDHYTKTTLSQLNFYFQLKACLGETEKLGALLHSGSPTLISHLALSPITAAKTRTAQLASANTSNNFLPSYYLLSFAFTIVYLIENLIQR